MKIIIRSKILLLALLAFTTANAQVLFEDVTDDAGPFHTGESWGAAWGDVNGDGWPDLTVDNHRHRNSLWRNNADGTFDDIMLQFDIDRVFLSDVKQDTHGSVWVDYDNDGDQDILSARSSAGGRGQLFRNQSGLGDEIGNSVNLGSFTGGRLGTFFDYDNDGDLDLFTARAGSAQVFQFNGSSYSNVTSNSNVGFSGKCSGNNYHQFADFYSPSFSMDMACGDEGSFPYDLYNITASPFQDVTSIFSTRSSNTNDTIFADFDGDLDVDLFALRGSIRPVNASRVSPTKIEAWLSTGSNAGDKGFTFTVNGVMTLTDADISRVTNSAIFSRVFIGSSGYHPTGFPVDLDPSNTANHGISSSSSFGFYIGYDPAQQQWTGLLRPSGHEDGYFVVEGQNISEPTMFGLATADQPIDPRFFRNDAGSYSPIYSIGLGDPISCTSVAAGDFDNDRDIDLYLICGRGVANLENIVYWNDGDGTFTRGASHGGEGPVGAGLEQGYGVAESVAMADYDVDGFLDFFITNGGLLVPQFEGGADTMIRNLGGNGNHWIQMDLVGTTSNTDGLGAKVTINADGVSQLREQNGGYHRWSQHHQRIHFGLGSSTSVTVTVDWPNGSQDVYNNVAADKLYKVTQGGSITEFVLGGVNALPAPGPGDECGSQLYEPDLDAGIFLYKDCGSGDWHMRAVAGGSESSINYTGNLSSSQNITNVAPFSLEGGDLVDTSVPNSVSYSLTMAGAGEDGFDFRVNSGASSCFSLNTPSDAKLYVGAGHLPAPLPLNLTTLASCLSISSADVSVSEADGQAQIDVNLLGASNQTITVDYQTANGSAQAGSDYTSGSGTLTFNPGDTVKSFTIPIVNDTVIESDETFTVNFSNVSSAATLATPQITVTIENDDSPVSNCGEPTIDSAVDREIFLWKDCTGNGRFNVRATAGSGSALTYDGNISTDQVFTNVNPYSIESSDVLDTTNPQLITFEMTMGNIWQDGFNFQVASGSTCLTLNLPAGIDVLVGENRTPLTSPFNIETLGPCQSGLSITDATVSEADGTANLTVSLSAASASVVTVDYATMNGSATAGLDYTAASGTLSFNPGVTSLPLPIAILQDTIIESVENFSVELSNATNALIGDASATVVINDDETNACGDPNYDRTTEKGFFIWQDCPSGEWHIRTTAGGDPVAVTYSGNLTSLSGVSNVTPFSFEGVDFVDITDPTDMSFLMKMANTGHDGIDFTLGAGNTCLSLDLPVGIDVLVGVNRTPVTPPFDIKTLGSCTVNPGNIPPVVVNPGSQSSTVGQSANLSISASDANGDTLSYSASGLPGGLNINNNSGVISGIPVALGTFNVTVTVSDGMASDNESFSWTIVNTPNLPPQVNAGVDQTITLPATVALSGSASDDGQPNPPGNLTTTWSFVSGPGTVSFASANSLSTSASFSADGIYVLSLTADDGALSTADELTVTVNAAPIACIDVDFESAGHGWLNLGSSTCSTGSFVRGTPNQVINSTVVTQVGGDHTTGSGNAMYTAFNTADGTDDVDSGECAIQSPNYSVSQASNLSVWYFHGQRDTGDDPSGDYFRLEYTLNNGASWTQIASNGDQRQNAVWTEATSNLPANSNVRIRVVASDGPATGDLVEAGVDDLKICPL